MIIKLGLSKGPATLKAIFSEAEMRDLKETQAVAKRMLDSGRFEYCEDWLTSVVNLIDREEVRRAFRKGASKCHTANRKEPDTSERTHRPAPLEI